MTTQENSIVSFEEDENKVEAPEKPVKVKKSVGYGVILFLMLVISAALAGGAYYFWQMQQKQFLSFQKQQNDIQSLKDEINKVSASVSENARFVASNATQASSLEKQILRTEVISQRAIEIVNRNQRDWALAEVDYLLRIAHQRIAVAKDIGGAIAALKGADDRLELLGDLKLFHIRKQLAKDIGGLNAIHQADVNGISLALDQVIAYLPQLPFKSVKDEIKVQFTDDDRVEQPDTKEKTFVDAVMETVKQIGEIKVHQRSIKAASGAEQQNSIEQLLRTYLLGARLAALRFDQTQFLHEITQASEIVRLHYDANDNRIKQLGKTLLGYSALQLSPNLPELTKAWSMLQKQIKNPTKQTVKSAVSNNSHKPVVPVNKGAKL